jgi:filamentous hemagglutinin family protein
MDSGGSLNHVYRTVWNQALGAMVAVSEISTSSGKASSPSGSAPGGMYPSPLHCLRVTLSALAIAIAWSATPALAQANPTGGVAIQGQAAFTTNGNSLLVTTQNGAGLNHSAINWQSFSIPTGSSTYFQQPTAASTSINRVVTNTPSLIFGSLGSNGNLVLVNQSGITVGAGAVVDTAGFTASALRMSDADALSGRLRFGDAASSPGAVSVMGNVLARSGDVVLMGSSVDTGISALVQAPNGSTVLSAGQQVEITGRGLEGIVMQVQAPTDSAVNLGTLKGDAVGIFAGTLKHSGLIQATTATLEGGRVVLKASGDTYVQDSSQTLATSASGKGGQIHVLGKRVVVTDSAVLDASGATGGGTVLVGGDYQGRNAAIQNASVTYFGPRASIKADATVTGDGGKVVVWADDTTRAYGGIRVKGGSQGGNGGFVETSGHRYLDFQGRVDTSAAFGQAGTLLLDPSDITIDNSALDINVSLLAGILTSIPTVNSTLTWATINAQSGNLTIQTNSSSTSGVGNISINASTSLSGPSTLTLLAHNNISFGSGALLNGGSADLNLYAGWTGSGLNVASGIGQILLNAGASLSTSGKVRFYAGDGVSQDATASLSASTLGIDSFGTVYMPGANQVGTLAAKVTGVNGQLIPHSFTYVGSNGVNIGSITGTGVASGVTTGGGSVTLTAATGNFLADSIVTKGAAVSGQAGTGAGAVNITAANGNISVGSIDTRGGAGGVDSTYQFGLGGGAGGNVSITRSAGNLSLTGLSIATSGGLGGTATSAIGGGAGGAGGDAGSISLQASTGDLKLDGTGSLTANGGYGGNAFVSGGTASGGNGGMSGAISLGARGSSPALSNKLETVTQTISSTSGTGGANNAGGAGFVMSGAGAVVLLAGSSGMIQSGGSLSATGTVSVTTDGSAKLSDISGYSLTVNTSAGNGAVTQTTGSALYLSNFASITSGAGDVTLANTGNQFRRVDVTSSGVVNLRDAGTLLNVSTVTAGSFTLVASGNISFGNGNVTATSGGVDIRTSGGWIDLAPDSTTDITSAAAIKLQATGDLHLQAAALTTGTGGDAIVASSGGLLQAILNNGVATVTLGTGGRWFTYLNSPLDAHTMGSFALSSSSAGFRQYGKSFGDSTALAQATGNGNIYAVAASANPFTATLNGAVSKTYDGLSAVTLSGVALTSLAGSYLSANDVGGNAVNGVGSIGPHVLASPVNVVATAQALSGVTDFNYGFPVYGYTVTASGNVGTVNAKTLSATAAITSVGKTYDGLLQAFGSSIAGSTNGALNGDTVALDTSGMFLDHSTAHAGATTINASGTAAIGTVVGGGVGSKDGTAGNAVAGNAGDYTLTQPTITNQGVAGLITARALTSSATITSVAKTYDGMLAASTSTISGSISGTVNGDTVALNTSGMFLDYNTAHAGVNATTISASGTAALGTFLSGGVGAKNGNAGNGVGGLISDYTLTQPTISNQGVAGSILAKQLTVIASIGGASSKTYDGTLVATGATVSGSTSGAIGSDVVALDTTGLTLSYSNAHVATTGKTIGATGMVAKGALSSSGSGAKDGSTSGNLVVSLPSDYEILVQPTISSVAATITARSLSASASIGGSLSKAYDGSTSASGASLSGTLGGAVAGDALAMNFSPVSLAYNNADVATANAIVATGIPTFSVDSTSVGSQLSDYNMAAPSIANAVANVTPRASSNWLGQGSGLWSMASNWDVMPSTGNVLAVSIPLGASVVFDAAAPSTSLQTVNSVGLVSVAGSSLSVSNAFNSADFSQTGGTLKGAGSFTVSNSFSQAGGTPNAPAGSIAMGGAVSIRQASGNLAVGSITGSSIALEAVSGAISQTAPLVTTGLLKVSVANGALLTDVGNAVSAFGASTTGTGDLALTNVGALDVQAVTVANGKLSIDNTGALITSGAIAVHGGGVDLTTHSPLTIANTVNADGSITLAALSPNSTSNIVINGAMASATGGISVQAYNNFVQNANLSAALAIGVSAGGTLSFGPSAVSIGNPVSYAVNGAPYVPPWIAATVSGGANSFVATFLDQFQTALDAQQVLTADDPLGLKQRRKEGVVVEGEVCKP